MRKVLITDECLDFFDSESDRVRDKFFELIEILMTLERVHSNYVKKLANTKLYELRVRAGNEYRSIIYTLDHDNFHQSGEIICLTAFHKKSTKDYKREVKKAEKILANFLNDG